MNSRMMFSVTAAIALFVIAITEAKCPDTIHCKGDSTPCGDGEFEASSYVKLDDGTECPSTCKHCLPNKGDHCPDLTCAYYMDRPKGCDGVGNLMLKIADGSECFGCEAATC